MTLQLSSHFEDYQSKACIASYLHRERYETDVQLPEIIILCCINTQCTCHPLPPSCSSYYLVLRDASATHSDILKTGSLVDLFLSQEPVTVSPSFHPYSQDFSAASRLAQSHPAPWLLPRPRLRISSTRTKSVSWIFPVLVYIIPRGGFRADLWENLCRKLCSRNLIARIAGLPSHY